MTDKKEVNVEQTTQMPALYEAITPLMTDVHKDLKMTNTQNYKFAAKINAAPIALQELSIAAKYFPIVFAGDNSGVMLAVLGLKTGDNLYVDKDYNWLPDTYIPAYIRRYPFFTAKRDEKSDPIICIDDTSDFFSADGERSLFEGGEPTDILKNIIDFTQNYHYQLELTVDFGREMEKLELLEGQQISFKVDGEVKANVNGFRILNRLKFDELDGQVLKAWLGKGWLDSAVLHLSSGSNFDRLWQLEQGRTK